MINRTTYKAQLSTGGEKFRRFASWLVLVGRNYHWVAELLEVSGPRANKIVKQGRCAPYQVEALRAAGVPEESLPVPTRGKPGPAPKISAQEAA